jgi:hypothetical protein
MKILLPWMENMMISIKNRFGEELIANFHFTVIITDMTHKSFSRYG